MHWLRKHVIAISKALAIFTLMVITAFGTYVALDGGGLTGDEAYVLVVVVLVFTMAVVARIRPAEREDATAPLVVPIAVARHRFTSSPVSTRSRTTYRASVPAHEPDTAEITSQANFQRIAAAAIREDTGGYPPVVDRREEAP
jgi:hypothetical protein